MFQTVKTGNVPTVQAVRAVQERQSFTMTISIRRENSWAYRASQKFRPSGDITIVFSKASNLPDKLFMSKRGIFNKTNILTSLFQILEDLPVKLPETSLRSAVKVVGWNAVFVIFSSLSVLPKKFFFFFVERIE